MQLLRDYLAGAPQLRPFYARSHRDLLQEPAAPAAWAAGLPEDLREFQALLGAPKEIRGNEAVIITGQQPGIFTGPLYTIYKAITAIHLARKYSDAHGVPCIPVFWVAGDDHDFEEVRTAHILNRHFEPCPLRYEPSHTPQGAPMYLEPAGGELHALVDEAAAQCAGEHREEISAFLHESIAQAESIAHWFALILARLFRDTPLCLFLPSLPAARRGAFAVMAREVASPLVATHLSNAAASRLEALGYPAQVLKGADECGFFLDVEGRRAKVLWNRDAFHLPTERITCTRDEMAALLEQDPARFSANVILRPIVQQALFPAAAYVAGPGEIAYWLQFREVFEHFGQPMPIVYPRLQALLLDTKTRKLREKFGLDSAAWFDPMDSVEQRALLNGSTSPLLNALRVNRPGVAAALDALNRAVEAAAGKDRAAAERTRHFGQHTLANLDRLEQTFAQADLAQADALRAQVHRVANVIAPMRKPQERVYCLVSWLFDYGWELIPTLMDRLDAQTEDLQEIEL